jgi:hypothetical protein
MPQGKPSVRWDMDVDILNRLRSVASMMIQGAKGLDIAEAFAYSLKTAYRDMERVRELWRREAQQDIESKRAASLAHYNEIKARAWEDYRKKGDSKGGLGALRLAMEIEDRIADLEGTKAPRGVDVTTKGQSLNRSAKEYTDDELAAVLAGKK